MDISEFLHFTQIIMMAKYAVAEVVLPMDNVLYWCSLCHFQVLFLDHPRKKIRDTARFKPFRKLFGGANPSLKKLCDRVLGVKVQEGEHNSVSTVNPLIVGTCLLRTSAL